MSLVHLHQLHVATCNACGGLESWCCCDMVDDHEEYCLDCWRELNARESNPDGADAREAGW